MVLIRTLEDQGATLHQGLGHLAACRTEQPLHRAARNAHVLAGNLLNQTLPVAKPEGLQLVALQKNAPQVFHGHAGGLEGFAAHPSLASSLFLGSWHIELLYWHGWIKIRTVAEYWKRAILTRQKALTAGEVPETFSPTGNTAHGGGVPPI